MNKKVTETYVFAAPNFGVAYKNCLVYISKYGLEDSDVVDMKIAKYKEYVIRNEDDVADIFYKVKTVFITIDENTSKEKKTTTFYLVKAENVEQARKTISNLLSCSMIDYNICSISETKIIDVIDSEAK